jgi:hypothetical protein
MFLVASRLEESLWLKSAPGDWSNWQTIFALTLPYISILIDLSPLHYKVSTATPLNHP